MVNLQMLAKELTFASLLAASVLVGASACEGNSSRQGGTFLLMGQSNMVGRGDPKQVSLITSELIEVYDAKEGEWITATEPLPFVEPEGKTAGIGPAMSFAQKLVDSSMPGRKLRLLPLAVGGSELARWEQGGDLWTRTLQWVEQSGSADKLTAIVWHQGESDAFSLEDASDYATRLDTMLDELRTNLARDDLPVIAGELGEFTYANLPGAESINQQLNALAKESPLFAVVDSAQLDDLGDQLHFSAASQRSFGQRYAQAWQALN